MHMPHGERTAWYIGTLILLGICIFVVTLTLITFFWTTVPKHGLCNCHKDPMVSFTVLTMILMLGYVCMDFCRTFDFLARDIDYLDSSPWFLVADNIVYYLAILSLYLVLMLRAYDSIKIVFDKAGRHFEITKCHFCTLVLIFGTDIIAIVLFLMTMYEDFTDKNVFRSGNIIIKQIKVFIGSITVIINDIFINLALFYFVVTKFQQRMKNLDRDYKYKHKKIMTRVATDGHYKHTESLTNSDVKTQGSFEIRNYRSISSSDLNDIRIEQNDMLELISKLSVLTVFCVVFSQLFNIAVLLENIMLVHNRGSDDFFTRLTLIEYIFRGIEAIACCIVLHFTYVDNQEQYEKYCKLCHHCARDYCVWCTFEKTDKDACNPK